MEVHWDAVLPVLSVVVPLLLMWWRMETKFERQGDKIEGVRQASENAHKAIRDDLCDLKVTTATIQNDVEWLKTDRQG